jgi:hypothetical protein
MKVLVLESETGAATIATAQLEQAGHQVLRCHEPGERAFPCRGLQGDGCPLDGEPVDVALTVRARPVGQPTALEDGVSCALRRHIPVVVAGRTTANPFSSFPVIVAGRDVVEACERAAAGSLVQHEAVAQRALDESMRRADEDRSESGWVEVTRRSGGLRATLHFPPGTPERLRAMASVRVVGALRAFDPSAAGIDVAWTADDQAGTFAPGPAVRSE